MKTQVNFVLVREGSSDDGLIPHLRSLLVAAGAGEATGTSRDYTGTVGNKLVKVMEEKPRPDVVFVHRDSDGRDARPRRQEIERACAQAGLDCFVPVVPVQELERGSWSMRAPSATSSAAPGAVDLSNYRT